LKSELIQSGFTAEISNNYNQSADINHFMSYVFADPCGGKTSILITHIDDTYKLAHIKSLQKKNKELVFVCLSRQTAQFLIAEGINQANVSYALPGIDPYVEPRKIKIGTSGRIYKDGRKNEKWLLEACSKIDISPFHFNFFGNGWEEIGHKLLKFGASVTIVVENAEFEKERAQLIENIKQMDFWMYLGQDEGSMGCLDAALIGIPLITTPQGFHLELPLGIKHEIESSKNLQNVLNLISFEYKELIKNRRNWTWNRFALDHLAIWNLIDSKPKTLNSDNKFLNYHFKKRFFSPRRAGSAILRTKVMLKFRKYLFK
jgi:hypothetical protein